MLGSCLNFKGQCTNSSSFCEKSRVVRWKWTDVSEVHVISIFTVEGLLRLLPASGWFLAWPFLRRWRWKWHVPPKRLLTFTRIHGVISQKTELFITTAVRIPLNRHFTSLGTKICNIAGQTVLSHGASGFCDFVTNAVWNESAQWTRSVLCSYWPIIVHQIDCCPLPWPLITNPDWAVDQ
jgi:hypothetical protein